MYNNKGVLSKPQNLNNTSLSWPTIITVLVEPKLAEAWIQCLLIPIQSPLKFEINQQVEGSERPPPWELFASQCLILEQHLT